VVVGEQDPGLQRGSSRESSREGNVQPQLGLALDPLELSAADWPTAA
jgi:hypothetical protein